MTVMAVVDERWSMEAVDAKEAFEDTMRLQISRVGNDVAFE